MMNKKQGVTTESSICKIENGFLLTYPDGSKVCVVVFDSLEHKTEHYKAESLAKILLKELVQEVDFRGVGDER